MIMSEFCSYWHSKRCLPNQKNEEMSPGSVCPHLLRLECLCPHGDVGFAAQYILLKYVHYYYLLSSTSNPCAEPTAPTHYF
uniref:Uncharacterized protein n=1 Tax=Kalanchoe fedtschenkoi TaxID=63787 RepID=A0A7N0VJ52_KALFE